MTVLFVFVVLAGSALLVDAARDDMCAAHPATQSP